jgi:hypothetical protein
MRNLNTEQLKSLQESGNAFALVNALSEQVSAT